MNDAQPSGGAGLGEPGGDELSRRRFLSLLAASAAFAAAAGCSRIERGKVVPYTRQPEEILPGVPTYYASAFQEGFSSHGVLVKTREGRPIHVEGNPEDPCSRGKAGLRAVADVLGLYDPDRLRAPSFEGRAADWGAAVADMAQALDRARATGRAVLLLTDASLSPTRRALVAELRRALPSLRHVAWEPAADHAALRAARSLYGEAVLPALRLERADVVLSLQADFLGGAAASPATIMDFAGRRRPAGAQDPVSRLWAAEGCMTLTGANADRRLQVRPSGMAALACALARRLHEEHGAPLPPGLTAGDLSPFAPDAVARNLGLDPAVLKSLAGDLHRARASALVIAGAALAPEAHAAAALLNWMLGAEGNTVDASLAVALPEAADFAEMRAVCEQAARGEFAAALFWAANPGHSFPDQDLWKKAVAGIPKRVRIGLYEDETALDCQWRLPEHHWLESWGDFEATLELLHLRQPAAAPLHDSRQGEDFLLDCLRSLGAGAPPSYAEYLKARWRREVYPGDSPVPFEDYWQAALHDGVVRRRARPRPARIPNAAALREALQAAAGFSGAPGGLELVLYPGTCVHDGRYANNGWLEELPDPVTKVTWGNPLLLADRDAASLKVREGDLVRVTAGAASVEVPVVVQPGQAPGVIGLALGYGRMTGHVGAGVGANAYRLVDPASASPCLRFGVQVTPTGRRSVLARTQEHHRMEGRDLARSWSRSEYARRTAGHARSHPGHGAASLIPPLRFAGQKWGMAIDLSACVGCSTCVIACQSENNVPVVGPEQVARSREMHWIRIDRYYEGDPSDPRVVHQPVLCQHCDNAPCEIVCPVNATTHSPDGLNQMTYNRCVGTRYCSNNCPFKVRRFNFLDYTSMKKEPENLAMNPEVTVRPRGVMEKCTFCVQRIQEARQQARVEGRAVADGEIRPACVAACPAGAMVFGDRNDPHSEVSRISEADRAYRMLEELGIGPAVTYLADIANPPGEGGRG